MFTVIGVVIVIAAVIVGYVMHHGNMAVLIQINEMIILFGAGFGSLMAGHGMAGVTGAIKGAMGLMKPDPYTKAAFSEQATIIAELEEMLRRAVKMDKINYLMLMMVDPHVHFHIFPRYRGERSFAGLELTDRGWPGPPDLKSAVELDSAAIGRAIEALR